MIRDMLFGALLFVFSLLVLQVGGTLENRTAVYAGHKVFRVELRSEVEIDFVSALQESGAVDVWSYDSVLVPGRMNDLCATPHSATVLMNFFGAERVEVLIDDLQVPILQELQHHHSHVQQPGADWFSSYHTGEEIVLHLKELAVSYPHLALLFTAGTSYQGKELVGVKLTGLSGQGDKKQLWINGGQHAREWIGPATVMFIIETLLTSYGKDSTLTYILDNFEFIIVPLVNPDGYEYTWTSQRLWRKNRRLNNDGSYGVDLNRNWDSHWGGSGSSSSPNSNTYRGTAPFSEPETKSISDYINTLPRLVAGVDIHSYSQLVLRPWGWTSKKPSDYTLLKQLGDGMADAIYQTHGKTYDSIAAHELYYAAGIANDWFYEKGGFLGYCYELRDTGTYGFLLPANQIVPTGQEAFEAIVYLAQSLLNE